jgi:opacity protein-like surface antigen
MKITRSIATIVVLLAGVSTAQAQNPMGSFRGFFTPFVGAATGGEVTEANMLFGASVSVQEQDGWGAELDFAHSADTEAGGQELDVTTYMVNASWIKPAGMIRPFGIAGGGVMQMNGCAAPCARASRTYDFGLTAGAGVLAVLNDVVGVRGDVRYFATAADHPDLGRPDNFNFWRVSLGVTLMWAILP